MIELSIEEKAKRYDEAIDKFDVILNLSTVKESGTIFADDVRKIFPELKENEDEKVKKEIGNFINYSKVLDETKKRWLAWLEKQNIDISSFPEEQQMFMRKYTDLNKITLIKLLAERDANNAEIIESFEKQCEQNPTNNQFTLEQASVLDKHIDKFIEQKSADKVEPKFKVGNWYQCTKDFFGKGVTFDKNTAYYCVKEGCLQDEYGCHIAIVKDLYDNFKLWDISDAKDGDVLVCIGKYGQEIGIIKEYVGKYGGCDKCFETYCFVDWDGIFRTGEYMGSKEIYPATKEQRDQLEKAMADAGYIFDFDKKELKKIEQKPDDLPKGEDYGIDGLYVAVDILQNTLGKVDGYQTDDGILEHKCAINAIKELSKQEPAWSEEDEKMLQGIWDEIIANKHAAKEYEWKTYDKFLDWLNSLKERVLPQPNQEWSEEDSTRLQRIIDFLWYNRKGDTDTIYQQEQDIDWLKSLRPQSRWKPSDEQMKILNEVLTFAANHESPHWNNYIFDTLNNLIRQLQKLKE